MSLATATIDTLTTLRGRAATLWEIAVDAVSEIDYEAVAFSPDSYDAEAARASERKADMRHTAKLALTAWDEAIGAADVDAAIDALDRARILAKSAGEDSAEREALALLRAV